MALFQTKGWLPELVIFAGTALLAWHQQWSATDLVWSLWISSLTLGYSYILVSIAGMFAAQFKKATAAPSSGQPPSPFVSALSLLLSFNRQQMKKGEELRPAPGVNKIFIFLALLPFSLFLVGFFTIHFLGFHFVHSLFLNGFFPLFPESASGQGSSNEFVLFKNLIFTTLKNYWSFIVASALSRLGAYRTAFQKTELGPSVGFAYINVVRMHVLIFIVGFMSGLGLQRFFLYAILFLYFFPFDSLVFRGIIKRSN